MEHKGKTVKVLSVSNEESQGFESIGLTGEIIRCELGRGFVVASQKGEYLHTSQVTEVTPHENKLTIKTLNSEYIFEIKEDK